MGTGDRNNVEYGVNYVQDEGHWQVEHLRLRLGNQKGRIQARQDAPDIAGDVG